LKYSGAFSIINPNDLDTIHFQNLTIIYYICYSVNEIMVMRKHKLILFIIILFSLNTFSQTKQDLKKVFINAFWA